MQRYSRSVYGDIHFVFPVSKPIDSLSPNKVGNYVLATRAIIASIPPRRLRFALDAQKYGSSATLVLSSIRVMKSIFAAEHLHLFTFKKEVLPNARYFFHHDENSRRMSIETPSF